MNMTKLVECPVVLSVPWRTDVLYTGHMYECEVPPGCPVYSSGHPSTSGISAFIRGRSCMYGMLTNNSRGRDSSMAWRATFHLAPSIKSPRMKAPSSAFVVSASFISIGVSTRKSKLALSIGT